MLLGVILISTKEVNIENISNRLKAYEQFENIKVSGVIIDSITESEYNKNFKVEVNKINETDIKNKIILNVSINKKKEINIFPGDYININGKYTENSSYNNFNIYNSNIQNKRKDIYGILKISSIEKIESENKKSISVRYRIIEYIDNKARLQIKENSGLLVGILIGKKDNISEEITEEFRKSGISHVLAVSGAHVACIVSIINIIFNKILHHYKMKRIILIFILVFFLFIVGNSPSILRAIIMNILIIISNLVYRKSNVYCNLSLSAIIVLIINPYYMFDLGFLLSYLATVGILLFSKLLESLFETVKEKNMFNKIKGYIIGTIVVSVSANLMIIPIVAYSTSSICISFILTNLLITPLVFILEFLGILFIFLPSINILNKLVGGILNLIVYVSRFCSRLPFSEIMIVTPNIFEIVIYYIFLFILYLKLKNKISKKDKKYFYRIVSVLIIISIVTNIIYEFYFIRRDLKIYFLDVGQGDSCLVITETGKKILIDGGGNENYDIGKNILKTYLLKKKIKKLDYIIISHLDYDHCGGIISLLDYIDTDYIILPIQYEIYDNFKVIVKKIKKKKVNTKILYLKVNDILRFDKYTYIKILWPFEKQQVFDNSINNNALVFKLIYNNFSVLFTGDIEEGAEKILVEKYKNTNILNSDILKVAHHGSDSSSIEKIIKLINPKIALISVGKNNKYGHPSTSIIKRLEKNNCIIYRTDLNGEIDIRVNLNKKIDIKKFKK